MMSSVPTALLRRRGALGRLTRAAVTFGALTVLAACSGSSEPGEMAANASLVHNDPYPNVAADPARGASAPRSSAEVRRIEDRMMSLAAEQGSASRAATQSSSVVEQMKALAKRNQSIAAGIEPPPAGDLPPTN